MVLKLKGQRVEFVRPFAGALDAWLALDDPTETVEA